MSYAERFCNIRGGKIYYNFQGLFGSAPAVIAAGIRNVADYKGRKFFFIYEKINVSAFYFYFIEKFFYVRKIRLKKIKNFFGCIFRFPFETVSRQIIRRERIISERNVRRVFYKFFGFFVGYIYIFFLFNYGLYKRNKLFFKYIYTYTIPFPF